MGAKICWDICPQTLSVPRSEPFSESVAPNGGYGDYYPSKLFRNAQNKMEAS